MALNYDISCYGIDELGNNIENAKIHAYFVQVDSGSSASKWDNDIRLTAGNGKVSFNLGDDSFLTSEGVIKTGDKVVICAWLSDGDNSNDDKTSKDTNTITKCINFTHTVDTSSSSWAEDFTILDVKSPVCDISIPTVDFTGHSFTSTNNSYITEGKYQDPNYDRNDLYQNLYSEGQSIYLGMDIKETFYDYEEYSETLANTDNSLYSYVDSGDYTITARVFNYLGYYCEVQKDEHILYNKPTIDFDYTFSKLLNTDKYIGVGNDDELITSQLSHTNYGDTWEQIKATFDWTLTDTNQDGSDNTTIYTSEDENFEPTKLYNTEGTKDITLSINWNDGFDNFSETMTLNPFLDIYKMTQRLSIVTEKKYMVDNIYVPLGDDDLVTMSNDDFDSASQNYNSNDQWKTLDYTIEKLKNDATDDSETFNFSSENGDDFYEKLNFYVRYYHDSDNKWSIQQDLLYWDGYKDVSSSIKYEYTSEKYYLTHSFYWETERHGKEKNIVDDNDKVSIYNTSYFSPQNNLDIITEDKYEVSKESYTSYTDETVIDDSETFDYTDGDISNISTFYVHKDGDFIISNTIYFYDGYDSVQHTMDRTVTASVLTPNIVFDWYSRNGTNVDIEGRDDLVTFENSSYLSDYYGLDYSITSTRNLSIDWYMSNNITTGNFININSIGGDVYSEDEERTDEFLDYAIDDKPENNFLSIGEHDILMIFYYNDGYFNRNSRLTKQINSIAYSDLIPDATYTRTVPDRNAEITFIDNSSNYEERIVDEDWSLTDRYEDNSMNYDLRGTDNLKTWPNIVRADSISTTVNSFENHTLSQDVIRWDNGYYGKIFSNSYTIYTTNYDINPLFSYEQKYVTGPEIIFANESTVNNGAVLLKWDMEISDTDNDGNDAFTAYRDISMDTLEQEHTYKSVSNSPFESDVYNKEVILFQDYDDGWNEVYDDYTEDILVKPNRISQSFILNPIRHPEDTETNDNIIVGNNPISFNDYSSFERTLDDFITYVKYTVDENDCS